MTEQQRIDAKAMAYALLFGKGAYAISLDLRVRHPPPSTHTHTHTHTQTHSLPSQVPNCASLQTDPRLSIPFGAFRLLS